MEKELNKIVISKNKETTIYRNITLEEMLTTMVNIILGKSEEKYFPKYYWNSGDEIPNLVEITECDLFDRLKMEDGDFSEFDWELEESRLYVKEENKKG